ncbi:hypothetical protein [Sorangium sp. So ce1000]|uniref:hypothetical protein n=1 Tax=Sorangium sp. So ce1000 TaxID=3133325 RepID=UPI003F60F06D
MMDQINPTSHKPKISKKAVVEMLQRIHSEMKAEWREKYPQMFKEQLHCSSPGSSPGECRPERAYWHYGNAVAFGEMAQIIASRFADDE